MSRKLRSYPSIDHIVGVCKTFEPNKLPSKGEVLQHFLHIRRNGKHNDPIDLYFGKTADSIIKVWQKTTIPIIYKKSVIEKLKFYYRKYDNICKSYKRVSFGDQVKKFQNDLTNLFDIAVCKCKDECKCSYQFKIPRNEIVFLVDQRGPRELFLALEKESQNKSVDQSAERKCEQFKKAVKALRRHSHTIPKRQRVESSPPRTEHFIPKRIKLTNVVRETQRLNISKRATATVLNAFAKDLGVSNEKNIIDQFKIARHTSKQNKAIEQNHKSKINEFLSQTSCFGLYFDGKKDKTNVYVRNEDTERNHLRKEIEDHYSLVLEPNHLFYTHVTPEKGTAASIAECIWQNLKKDKFDLDKLLFIGCDGTNVNTGLNNGKQCLLNHNY